MRDADLELALPHHEISFPTGVAISQLGVMRGAITEAHKYGGVYGQFPADFRESSKVELATTQPIDYIYTYSVSMHAIARARKFPFWSVDLNMI